MPTETLYNQIIHLPDQVIEILNLYIESTVKIKVLLEHQFLCNMVIMKVIRINRKDVI